MEEIEKLRLRVEKDSNSRLFLPLAEEYRKTGMLDEAIAVILRGLEYQPGYTSARVALGRLYLEKDMIEEARTEFEIVVKTIPDNLFSHKKLAEIYKAGGHSDMAIREYRKVIELNPLDDDARTHLEELEGKPAEAEEITPVPVSEEPAVTVQEEIPETLSIEEEPAETAAADVAGENIPADDAFEDFKASFSTSPEEEAGDVKDLFELPAEADEKGGLEDIFGTEEKGAEQEDGLGIGGEEAEAIELVEDTEIEDVFAVGSDDSNAEIELSVSDAAVIGEVPHSDNGEDMSKADSFIAGGDYLRAMEIYRKALSGDPDNRHVLQRVTELKALLKMLGKSDELIIARLDAFLGGIKRNFEGRR